MLSLLCLVCCCQLLYCETVYFRLGKWKKLIHATAETFGSHQNHIAIFYFYDGYIISVYRYGVRSMYVRSMCKYACIIVSMAGRSAGAVHHVVHKRDFPVFLPRHLSSWLRPCGAQFEITFPGAWQRSGPAQTQWTGDIRPRILILQKQWSVSFLKTAADWRRSLPCYTSERYGLWRWR